MHSLLEHMSYDDITIQLLAEEADIARATFYRHYGSIDELLTEIFMDYSAQVRAFEENFEIDFEYLLDFNNIPPDYALFVIVDQHREVFKNLFLSSAQNRVTQTAMQIAVERVTMSFEHVREHYPELNTAFIVNHIAIVILGYLYWWIREGYPYDAEYMARLAHNVSMTGAMNMVGLGHLIIPASPDVWQLKA